MNNWDPSRCAVKVEIPFAFLVNLFAKIHVPQLEGELNICQILTLPLASLIVCVVPGSLH